MTEKSLGAKRRTLSTITPAMKESSQNASAGQGQKRAAGELQGVL
jgi:hypothetical protein